MSMRSRRVGTTDRRSGRGGEMTGEGWARPRLSSPGEWAAEYLRRGWRPVPLKFGKNPGFPGWEGYRATEGRLAEDFRDHWGVGLQTGSDVGDLCDVDLDTEPARRAAPFFLPETGLVGGHPTRPSTHWLYVLTTPLGANVRRLFDPDVDPNKGKRRPHLEVRGSGHQTAVCPTVHPETKRLYHWDRWDEPAEVTAEALVGAYQRTTVAAVLGQRWAEGMRNDATLAVCGVLARLGWPEEEAGQFLRGLLAAGQDGAAAERGEALARTFEAERRGDPIIGWNKLTELFGDGVGRVVLRALGATKDEAIYGQRRANGAGQPVHVDGFTLDQAGMVGRLWKGFGGELRFVTRTREWAHFDEGRWAEKGDLGARVLVRKAIERMKGTSDLLNDRDKRDFYHALSQLDTAGVVGAVCKLAEADERFHAAAEEFDRRPWSLNCRNGIVDLQTGQLTPHDAEAMASRQTPVEYHGDRAPGAFGRVLAHFAMGDGGRARMFRRLLGYSMTGLTGEDVIPLLVGAGGGGKSSLLNGIVGALGHHESGGYAAGIPGDYLTKSGSLEMMRLAARLQGVRVVICAESVERGRIDEEALKRLTGGDQIVARDLYERHTSYQPQMKVWFAMNEGPQLSAGDSGVWRRLKVIPTPPRIERPDLGLRDALLNDRETREGALALLVECAVEYAREGLYISEDVVRETEGLRRELDTVAMWADDYLEAGDGRRYHVRGAEARASYVRFCKDCGYPAVGPQRFSAALRGAPWGLRYEKTAYGREYVGARLVVREEGGTFETMGEE
jgi:putative DNA primase/helicase